MFDALSEGGLFGYSGKFFTVMEGKPPLIAVRDRAREVSGRARLS